VQGGAQPPTIFSSATGMVPHHQYLMTQRKPRPMKILSVRMLLCLPLALACLCAQAATYYVDSAVASSGNGESWGTAWKGISNITGLSAGDVVYFSGGPSGATRTYSVSNWSPLGGTAANPITYKIGQDSSHNGTAIFDCGQRMFLTANNYTVISGDAGDGQRHFALSNPSAGVIFWIGDATGVRISYINMGNIVGGAAGGETPVRMGNPKRFELDNCYAILP
jgi:hypothetical protein